MNGNRDGEDDNSDSSIDTTEMILYVGGAIVGRHYLEMSEDNDDAHYKGATSCRSTGSSSFRGPKTAEKLDSFVELLTEMLKTRREHEKNRTTEDQLYSIDECIKLLKSFGIEPHKLAKLLNKDYLMNFEFKKLLMGLEATYIKAFIDNL